MNRDINKEIEKLKITISNNPKLLEVFDGFTDGQLDAIINLLFLERKRTLEEVMKEIVAEDIAVWKAKIGAKTERRLTIKDIYHRVSKLKV